MNNIKITKLDNGLRVITDHVDSVHSVAVGLWVGVGTRHENPAHNGVAHMVEHMLFKGTPTRNALKIAEDIENVGGHMNAYTSKDMTAYYVHLLKDDVRLAVDILADMYQNSTLPEDEIARERGVILQEIGMSNDTPDDLIYDHYYETAYPKQGLGAPILGRADNITAMTRGEIAGYIKHCYSAENTILSAAGNVDHDTMVALARDYFTALPTDAAATHTPAAYHGGDHRLNKDLEQAHVILGFRGVGRLDPAYNTARVLSTVLGGGMSSRLFQEVREKRGLVYSIYSFHSGYIDDGQFGIYAGTGPNDLKELMPVLCDELRAVTKTVTDDEIARAKAQIKSGILIGRESMIARAEQQAKYLNFHGAATDVDDLIARIDAITPTHVMTLAQQIFQSPPTLAALGPLDHLPEFEVVKDWLGF